MKPNRRNKNELTPQITVTAAECGGNAEKMVRKFSKKVKKEGLIEELRTRSHFVKPTVVRAEKKRQKKRAHARPTSIYRQGKSKGPKGYP